jgi:hypothetical protein
MIGKYFTGNPNYWPEGVFIGKDLGWTVIIKARGNNVVILNERLQNVKPLVFIGSLFERITDNISADSSNGSR